MTKDSARKRVATARTEAVDEGYVVAPRDAGSTEEKLATMVGFSSLGRCMNCDAKLGSPRLFCGELCRQTAHWIRKARRWSDEGRLSDPDIHYAVDIGLAHILGGGYPERERKLPVATRQAVIARAGGKCELCGESGEEIDHMAGSSPDPGNLRLLCRLCHRSITMANLAPAGEAEQRAGLALWARVVAPEPQRICDDYDRWDGIWRSVLAEQRAHFQWLSDVDEAGEFGDGSTGTIEDDEHRQYMMELARRDD